MPVSTAGVADGGRKAPALRFGDLRVQALAGALANLLMATTGITDRHLRVLMAGPPGRPHTASQARLCSGLDLAEQQCSGFRHTCSVHQVEYSRNLLFRVGGGAAAGVVGLR